MMAGGVVIEDDGLEDWRCVVEVDMRTAEDEATPEVDD